MKRILLPALALLLAGCATLRPQPPLRVGVTPDYPPIIMKDSYGTITGLEVDFAKHLAGEMGRSLELVVVPWSEQVPALLRGTTDLIMSGMSVTDARKVRIDFCDPYMKSGLMALVRLRNAGRYGSRDAILDAEGVVGVQKGTTAETFARQNCARAQVIPYDIPDDAALAVLNKRLEIYLSDAPAVLWFASKYEADLTAVPVQLTQDELAWGIRTENADLKKQVNAILARWKTDGTLQELLNRWVPFVKR